MKLPSIVFLTLWIFATVLRAENSVGVLPAPQSLTAQSGLDERVELSWTPSAGAESYLVFRSTTQNDASAKKIAAQITTPKYVADALKNDTTYYFRVKAVGAGRVSDFSTEASATTKRTRPETSRALPTTASAPDPGLAYVPKGYALVFSDEFDGAAIDSKKWETLAPFSQPHLNDEIECYEPGGVSLEKGNLVLRAEERTTSCGGAFTWRSGSITSKATWTSGYFEARLKLPRGQGLWPAFWLTSSKRWPPEWDILEVPHTDGTLFQYMHPTKDAKVTWVRGSAGDDSIFSAAEGMPNPYSGYVVYGCEVTAEEVKLWVNGTLTAEWKVSGDSTDPLWVCLNLAVGGHWPGMPDATTPRPAEMFVDYLRIYQPKQSPVPSE